MHHFLFFRLESVKPEPCLNLFVFIWDFYLWMVFPVCCVDVALKQGGDPPRKVKQGFRIPTREPQLVPPGPLATPGTNHP